jgi:hypothetical protein
MKSLESHRPFSIAVAWLFVNALGAGVFLFVASASWIEPELASIPGASGGAGVRWFVTAVPILVLFALIDLGVLTWASTIRVKQGVWPISLRLFLLSVPLWLCALVVDNLHHGA